MKAIKDPAETRKIEGYKKPELTIAELLIKYDNSLKELSYCQCGSNSECYESMKENIKIIFGSGVGIERIEQIIKMAIEKKRPDVFAAELSRIEFENQQKFQKLIEENFAPEELWRKGTAVLSDAGPDEEDETREPRPDEPEEYWKVQIRVFYKEQEVYDEISIFDKEHEIHDEIEAVYHAFNRFVYDYPMVDHDFDEFKKNPELYMNNEQLEFYKKLKEIGPINILKEEVK